MNDPAEREALEALLLSPGWHHFKQFVQRQWRGDVFSARLVMASKNTSGEKAAGDAVLALVATQEAINDALSWPQERVKVLVQAEVERKANLEPVMSRRGNL